jgi:predicted CoA-binding protein
MNAPLKVVVVGASPKADRMSHQAVIALQSHGFAVIPVRPGLQELLGLPVAASLDDLTPPVDTVTMYVNAARSDDLRDELLRLHPRRVIFNPGAENEGLREALASAGVVTENACTLVLLSTGQF